MTGPLAAYIPQDRLRALASGIALPDRTNGSVLFVDISGFTPLTEALTDALGPRRGVEQVSRQVNAVYEALIVAVERYGGNVIGFAGDAITCWFDGEGAARAAAACAFAQQAAMQAFGALNLPGGATVSLAIKVVVASGTVRRFVVGDPAIQRLDTLAGATVGRVGEGENLSRRGEILADDPTLAVLGQGVQVLEWRINPDTATRFAVLLHTLPAPEAVSTQPPTIPLEQLREWVLPAVSARELAGQGEFVTEFRPAASLFARFGGIDYERDDAGAKLDAFTARTQGIVTDYGGTLLQLTIADKGSYIHAVFGAPVAHEDDAQRAVKAALELQDLPLELQDLTPLQIGVTRGTLSAGILGGSTRRTYNTWGDEVNLAARLMSVAVPGEILLSGRAQQAVANAFTFEPRPPLSLKGKAEPLPVFAVTGARQQRAIRLQEPTYALPMVGRQADLQTIRDKMDLTLHGQGQVIGIVADAGMGKSRLVAEVIRLARRKGFTGYGGACQSDAVNTPYLAWKPIWSAFFGVDPELPLRKQVRLLAGEIEDRAPSRMDALPLLSAVLDLPIPDNDFTKTLEPKLRKSALHALLEDCLKADAHENPILLVIEDMQWIDALSHDLLDELARAMTAFSVCIVLAHRPPRFVPLVAFRLESLPHFTKIELAELSPAECEQAVRAKLAQLYPARRESVKPLLVEKLMARGQGNPFYLEEMLNYLRDRGLDPLDEADLAKIELPDSLHALVLSRIDQLTDSEKVTLRVASIIGRLFRVAWLHGYYPGLGDLSQVKADLHELDALDITPLATPDPELAYLFKHIITHEVAYESLPYAIRARLHEQLAEYLEAHFPDAPPLDTLAFHYGQSVNIAKQREYWRKAADAAQAAFANDTVLEYYARLLPLLTESDEQVDLHLQWGTVLERMGRWDDAHSHFQGALAQAMLDSANMARCQFALSRLCYLRGDYPAALKWLEQARNGWSALNEQAGLGKVLITTGHVFWLKGEYAAARQHLEAGLALVRQVGDRHGVGRALNNLGLVALEQREYASARLLFEESLALAREMDDRWSLAIELNNLGLVAQGQGDFAAARALCEESLALAREMGDRWTVAVELSNLGLVAIQQGEYAAARALCEESLALAREIGDRWGIAYGFLYLGIAAYNQGEYAAARALCEESLALAREIGDKKGTAASLMHLGSVLYLQGDYAAAQALYEESLALHREMGDCSFFARLLHSLGLLAHSQGDHTAARALYEEGLTQAREIGDAECIARSLHSLGIVANDQDDHTAARTLFRESLSLARKMGSKRGIVETLVGLAGLTFREGAGIRAARLAASAETLRAATQLMLGPLERRIYDETVASARVALGEEGFAAAWAEGQNKTMEEAVEMAMGE